MAETPLRSRTTLAVVPARSSRRAALERAPRLRRIAELVELQADQAVHPSRARRVARDMRLRATAIEVGDQPVIDAETIQATLQFMAAA